MSLITRMLPNELALKLGSLPYYNYTGNVCYINDNVSRSGWSSLKLHDVIKAGITRHGTQDVSHT